MAKPAKLAYKVFEPSSGADENLSPVIFLHGMADTKEIWNDIPQVIANRTRRKAYAVDAGNHGDSEYTDVFSFDQNADDLLHFMDTINAPKAILVGHSMGGITSVRAALKNPERVEMMFSEDMYAKKFPTEVLENLYLYIDLWIKGVRSVPNELNQREAISHAMDYVYSQPGMDDTYRTDEESLKNLNVDLRRTTEGGYDVKLNVDVLLKALKNPDTLARELSGQFNGPAYFIYGSVSSFQVGKEEEHIKSHFPNAELIEFEGATHNVHVEFPEKFSETIVQRLIR